MIFSSMCSFIKRTMVKEVCDAEVLEKISYQITLRGRVWSLKTYCAPLARESSGESLFLRILYRSFSFSKVSKSSATATRYSKYKVKKSAYSGIDQPWRCYLFSRDLYFTCSSVSLQDGQNIPKQSDIKKSSVETYDKKQVFDLFLKGANNMVFFE